jgi:hypothetical protein
MPVYPKLCDADMPSANHHIMTPQTTFDSFYASRPSVPMDSYLVCCNPPGRGSGFSLLSPIPFSSFLSFSLVSANGSINVLE